MKRKSVRLLLLAAAFLLSACATPRISSSEVPSSVSSSQEETSTVESSSSVMPSSETSVEPSSGESSLPSSTESSSETSQPSSEGPTSSEISSEPSSTEPSSEPPVSSQTSEEPSSSEVSSESSVSSSESSSISSEEPYSSEPSSAESSLSSQSSTPSIDPYGWNVDYGKYGEEFQKKLASLIEDMKPDTTSYSSCLNVGAIAAAFPNDNSNTFIPFYHAPTQSEVTTTSSCNREHTWPNSRGGGMIERDPLIIRPTLTKDNSSRGNNFYGLGSNEWDPADCGYEGARGESARIILYAATRYASIGLTLSNNPGDSSSKHTMGTLSILLEWNNEYAPSDFERKVNERYAKMGYARNPFVDCPDFANYIYDENGYRTSPYEGGEIIVSSSSTSEYSSETPISSESSSDSHGQWNLVTEADDLAVGDEFVIACNTAGAVAGALSGAILTSESATFSSDKTTILDMGEGFQTFTLGAATGGYELLTEQGALGATAVKKLAIDDGSTVWKITFSGGNATIANGDSAKGSLEYNKSSPRFTTYTSGQTAVQIYRAA